MANDNAIKKMSLCELFSRYRLIIPEIQREYVWGDPIIGRDVLNGFYTDILKGYDGYLNYNSEVNETMSRLRDEMADRGIVIEDDQLRGIAERQVLNARGNAVESNVGFIYAYLPAYANAAVNFALPGYLIDGQQRLTTLVLLWLYMARKSGRMTEFLAAMGHSTELHFAFRVRQRTATFFQTLVDKVADNDHFDFSAIDDMTWYLTEYRTDISICSMVNALKQWDFIWAGRDGSSECYDYFTNNLHFWLYVVRNTIQGEKLYITMNGRGKGLTPAEIIRARVFQGVGEDRANEVGRTFEGIYDFFWTHRIPGELTADAGVQKFFRWVYLLDRYERWIGHANNGMVNENALEIEEFRAALQNQVRGEKRKFELKDTMFAPETGIGFLLIKRSFAALGELLNCVENADVVCNGASLQKYVPSSLLGEKAEGNSFQQDAMWVLPLLRWMSNQYDSDTETFDYDASELIRFARYIRNLISVKSIQKSINTLVAKAIQFADVLSGNNVKIKLSDCILGYHNQISDALIPDEEVAKDRFLRTADEALRSRTEAILWAIEDFKRSDRARMTEAGYKIGAVLAACHEDWRNAQLDEEFLASLEDVWSKFRSFVELQQQQPDVIAEWLLYPNHQGYREYNGRLVPLSCFEILERPLLLREVQSLMSRVAEEQGRGGNLFAQEQAQFLEVHWVNKEAIDNPITLAGLAVSIGALSGGSGVSAGMTQLEFKSDLPQGYEEHGLFEPVGVGDRAKYFWLLRTNACQRHSNPWPNNLLPFHRLTAEQADNLVNNFLTAIRNGTIPDCVLRRFNNAPEEAVMGQENTTGEGLAHHRNTDRYYFNRDYEHRLYKNELVRAIALKYVADNPNCTEEQFYERFPRDLKGRYGIAIRPEADVVNRDETRWYMDNEYRLHLANCELVVSNQWGASPEFDRVILIARQLGYTIEVVPTN